MNRKQTPAAGSGPLHPLVREIWLFWIAQKANKNLEKWGVQDFETLGLAVCEEAGELAQAILQNKHEGGERGRITHEALDLAALCVQVLVTMVEKHGAENVFKALRVPCAKCDRGDGQAGHADGCSANKTLSGVCDQHFNFLVTEETI